MTGWRISAYTHVAPLNDLIDHEDSDTCACGPRIEETATASGEPAWIIVHNSLDGREATER